MYEAHFGLRWRPFPASPDCQCYYPATEHERALAQLHQALQDSEAIVLLTGGPGIGKTLLGQRLLEQRGEEVEAAFLTHCRAANGSGLFQSILYDLGQPHEGQSEPELRLRLTDYLLKTYAADRRTLLVLDEAQHLSITLLEDLRLLGNLEGPRGKALQVVLLAQEMFADALRRPALDAFRQRLGAQARLQPLDVHEAADYLVYHLRRAGGQPEAIMTDEALGVLARGTQGIPRLLNRTAHAALRLASQAGAEIVDAEIALESLAIHGLSVEDHAGEAEAGLGDFEIVEGAGEAAIAPATVLPLDTASQEAAGAKALEGSASRRLFAIPKRLA